MNKIETFLANSTNSGINALVQATADAVRSYLARPNNILTGKPDTVRQAKAEAMVEAVTLATEGALTLEDFIA